jgi:IS5 family transposase
LEKQLPKLSSRRPQVVLIDATGIKVCGEGEWKVKVHGKTKRRKWIKLHIGLDEKTQEVVSLAVTSGNVADCKAGKEIISNLPKSMKLVKADTGYDTSNIRNLIKDRGGTCLIPPRKNAVKKRKGRGTR